MQGDIEEMILCFFRENLLVFLEDKLVSLKKINDKDSEFQIKICLGYVRSLTLKKPRFYIIQKFGQRKLIFEEDREKLFKQ